MVLVLVLVLGTLVIFISIMRLLATKGVRIWTEDPNQVESIQDEHHDPRGDTQLDDVQRVALEALPEVCTEVEVQRHSECVSKKNMNDFELSDLARWQEGEVAQLVQEAIETTLLQSLNSHTDIGDGSEVEARVFLGCQDGPKDDRQSVDHSEDGVEEQDVSHEIKG